MIANPIKVHLLHPDGRVEWEVGHELAYTAAPPTTVWIDIRLEEENKAQILALLSNQWGFHPLAIEDCINNQIRAKYERYPSHDFMVLLALDHETHAPLDTTSVCVFLRDRLIVSCHWGEIRALGTMRVRMAAERLLGLSSDRLVHAMVDTLVDEFMPLLDNYELELDDLDRRATRDDSETFVNRLFHIRRDLLHIRRILGPFQEIMRRFADSERGDVSADCKLLFRDVLDHVLALQDLVNVRLEICNGIIQTHTHASNERLNKVMKYLAVVSTLSLPMTVISGIFGMNFEVIPITHQAYGFYTAIGLMGASALVLMGIFRWRRWV